jgi:ABC-type multidrug transport system ATPase subunit
MQDKLSEQAVCTKVHAHAGKSTTINMLTGVLPPSGGDAVMAGESIRSPGGMAAIQANMGVCPQFDVLWNELTGLEHLIIFGYMKGLPDKRSVRAEADKLLKEARCFG